LKIETLKAILILLLNTPEAIQVHVFFNTQNIGSNLNEQNAIKFEMSTHSDTVENANYEVLLLMMASSSGKIKTPKIFHHLSAFLTFSNANTKHSDTLAGKKGSVINMPRALLIVDRPKKGRIYHEYLQRTSKRHFVPRSA
jgi:hypothetical protein